jgi:hypothetical protein
MSSIVLLHRKDAAFFLEKLLHLTCYKRQKMSFILQKLTSIHSSLCVLCASA